MDEDPDSANQPMLPLMRGDDRDALYLLLVVFTKPAWSASRVESSSVPNLGNRRSWTLEPRSLLRTFGERPVHRSVTIADDPTGKVLEAGVNALVESFNGRLRDPKSDYD
jgi:hypothetical protein